MQLEQTLQMYEIRRDGVDRIISYGGLYELLSGNCGGGPKSTPLSGGIYLDLNKSTKNTTILKEDLGLGELFNIYIHHDRGDGRMETGSRIKKGKE
nr:hypothetical protein [Candidatus Woesearchaeota archaeon]